MAEAIRLRLDSDAFRDAVARRRQGRDPSADIQLLQADERALEEAGSAFYVERILSKPEWTRVRRQLTDRIEATRRRLARASGESGMARVATLDLAAEWARHDARWQHEVAGAVIEQITVNPAPRRGRRFDPSRLDVAWRD